MLMNCRKCTTLTPDYVNKASGLELHQFKWLEGPPYRRFAFRMELVSW